MGFFDFFRSPDINAGVEEYAAKPGAVLLDVRSADEYSRGHIPGSINIPLDTLDTVGEKVKNKSTPVYVHCLSGGRSRQAAAYLERMGYTDVKNIGGISAWKGKVER